MALFGGNDQELRVTIKAKDEASKDIAKVQTSIGRLAGGVAVGTIAVDALRTGFRFLSGVVTDSIREFEQQNLAVAQMNATLRSTGFAAGLTARQLVDLAEKLSATSLYTDDAVLSAQNLLLTFTNITGDTFPRATEAVLNMSTALGQDLSSSAIQLGKALNNPIEGVSALQRVGVNFNNSQQEMIEKMVKTGRTIDAQTFILQELEREFGNSAKSAYEAASSITRLQKNVGELKEDIGSGLTPAINNLFGAFEAVTRGMGRNVDVGKVTFRTFATIGEFAANTAAGVRFLAGEIVKLGSYVVQVASVVGVFGKGARQGFANFREGVQEGTDTFVDFALTLKQKNESVLNTWGDLTSEARVFGAVGPAAYQATGKEAEAAAKKMNQTKQAVAETRREIDNFRKSLQDDTTTLATAFVEQEQKVEDIRKQLAEEEAKPLADRDRRRVLELRSSLNREHEALQQARTIEDQLPTQTVEARRRAGLTDFSREVEDIMDRSIAKRDDFRQQIVLNVNFHDAVAGDDGIRRIINQAMAELNRQATLTSAAGR
jgi:phage-related minor tail protein